MNVFSTDASTLKHPPCVAKIKEIHSEGKQVRVEIRGKACEQPTWAVLGKLFTCAELHLAIDNQLDCLIEFVDDDPSIPSLTDIYFSLLGQEEIIITAERMILEGKQELTVISGETETKYSDNDGRITTKATHITSQAEKVNRIRGSKIELN
ncbi:hypothetical protein [Vibrio neptunius]|uniref:hypothetical protein n=1 Tax=Vibrio neptunius TaxID=170651 RepID=UPI001F099EA0|nr:hypothetical protein [Vibrio neptunius]